jgi:hypothetical protein
MEVKLSAFLTAELYGLSFSSKSELYYITSSIFWV